MKLSKLCSTILYSEEIDQKLVNCEHLEFDDIPVLVPDIPARSASTQFSTKQIRFPRGGFEDDKRKAIAIHSFANHELLAVEMMAVMLIKLPHVSDEDKRLKRSILSTLKDEQRHFKLYRARLNELNYEFGDFPCNRFFWKYMCKIETKEQYFAIMSLTFEGANLDFASYYEKAFRDVGDTKTANILKEVYEDELSHVALGGALLSKWKADASLWSYYLENLPTPLTPARAKGQKFNLESRQEARLPGDFIQKLESYRDDFAVTQRKQWTK